MLAAANALNEEIVGEGAVLMKNTGALPLPHTAGKRIGKTVLVRYTADGNECV